MKEKLLSIIRNDPTKRSSALNFALKPVSVILGLIYTPLLLRYLGDEKYGLWSTVLSIISWVNYFDVGIGHGLRNVLTKALSLNDDERAKRAISTAFLLLSFIALLLLVVGAILLFSLNWHVVFNTETEMQGPLFISFIFICLNFVLALSNVVLYSLQQSHKVAIRNCIIQIMNIIGIVLLLRFTSSSLVLISVLFGITTSIVYFANIISLKITNSYFQVSFKYFDRREIGEITNVGLKFFVIQVACIALYTVDNLLITNIYGGEAVTPFNITYKFFNTAYAFLGALCVPYWSRTTEAYEKKDVKWLKTTVSDLNKVAIVFIIGFIVLALVFKPIARLWIGRDLNYQPGLITVMSIYYCLYTIVTVKTQMINGTGQLNFQLVLMSFMGIANIPLSIFLAKTCGLGVVGIRLATTILMAVAAICLPLNLDRIIKKMDSHENQN